MILDQFLLGMDNEIIVDLFAGGGGMSTAIEQALGRHVDIAINHDMDAISAAYYLGDRAPLGPLCPECGETTGPADDIISGKGGVA